MHSTYYLQPARCWEEALPIGNGFLGGMVYGTVEKEQIDLNDDTLWSGYPRNQNPQNTKECYRKVTALTLAGDYCSAQKEVEISLESGWTQTYLPLGSLWIETPELAYTNYQRSLDFTTATAHTQYQQNGVVYNRTVYTSFPDNCMVIALKSSAKGALNASFSLTSPLRSSSVVEGDDIVLSGVAPSHAEPNYSDALEESIVYQEEDAQKGMRFTTRAKLMVTGGIKTVRGNKIVVCDADEISVLVVAQTSFNSAHKHPYLEGVDEAALCLAKQKAALAKWDELYARHLADFMPRYQRTCLALPENKNSTLPTDLRLDAFLTDKTDCALYALLFHFGRYLALSCSREGSKASTLQGIWNSEVRPPWSSNYTININTQMNYWPALPANLLECHTPMVDFVCALQATGERTAQEMYGVDGFVAHHNSDIWLHTSPVGNHTADSTRFAFWNASAAWLCRSLAEQYDYTLDKEYLAYVYPTIRSAALFLKNILAEEDGRYLLCPSTSPENAFYNQAGDVCYLTKNATMSVFVSREIFKNVIRFSTVLQQDADFAKELAALLPQLKDNGIGAHGQLCEWDADYEETEQDHRHVSHLYGLYPGDQITLGGTPELAAACEASLDRRGDDGTGWSLGWKTCLWARLGQGEHAISLLKNQLRPVHTTSFDYNHGGGTYINLFDAHPPMQIDGNFAATAAICECLLQNSEDGILLLPALPAQWSVGSVKGLCAKKRIAVDIRWTKDGCEAVISSDITQTIAVSCWGQMKVAVLQTGTPYQLSFAR